MLISNPPTIVPNPIQNPGENALFLRVNQHIAGEVIKVENEQVILSIQGVQVVARMTTPEQSASLVERRFAQFIVKDMTGEVLTLQLAETAQPPSAALVSKPDAQLMSKLLGQLGIAEDHANQLIAHAAIRTGLTITPALVQELQSALAAIPGWEIQHAQAAALLKSLGLSITPGKINLMVNTPSDISGQLQNLIGQFSQLVGSNRLPPQLQNSMQNSLAVLQQAVVDPNQSTNVLAEKIHNAVVLLGKSVENELLDTTHLNARLPLANGLERGLMVLSRLRNELVAQGMNRLAGSIDQFNDSIRLMHLMNSSGSEGPSSNSWIRLEIPVNIPGHIQQLIPGQNEEPNVKLRIARDPDADHLKVNPHYTRLVIRMDINNDDVIEVDLSVVDRAAGLSISTSNAQLTKIARTELPKLCDDLQQSGYDTKISQVETNMKLLDDPDISSVHNTYMISAINLEA